MRKRMVAASGAGRRSAVAGFVMCVLASSTAGAEPRADTVSRNPAAASTAGAAEKLPTDDTLRKGMAAIGRLVHDHHSLVTHRRLPPATAVSFAAQVRNETDAIVAKITLSGQAADALTPILGKLVDGAEAIAGRKPEISQLDGIFLMDEALATYGARFEDPAWNEKQ